MGKRPCHAKKNEAHLCGLLYHSTIQDRMATEKARIVLAACNRFCLLRVLAVPEGYRNTSSAETAVPSDHTST